MKTLIIIILILIVVGLYFMPDTTKEIIKTTGHAVWDIAKSGIEKIRDVNKNLNETVKISISKGD